MMSKEKQIVEIKECIDAVYGADCAYYDVDGFAIAEEIYKAGYRKQREGAWVKTVAFSRNYDDFYHLTCPECGARFREVLEPEILRRYKYCSVCGAKMKGGTE